MPTVALYTLGCKVSQYETEAIGEGFEREGFTVVPFPGPADAVVVNTCTVTAESDRKSRNVIRRALGANPAAVVAVVGCYGQRAPEEVAAIPGVSLVFGTADKLAVIPAVERRLSAPGAPEIFTRPLASAPFEPMCITKAPRTRAYVKIEDGCECRCTYCAISAARGPVRSKRPEDVIAEVEALYRGGTREIVLTGIETASYGKDFEKPFSLADLLSELDRRKSCERIRLGSLAPELIDRDFITRVAPLSILAPHFHLSVQSGSSAVLRRMRRRYNAEQAMERIRLLRENIPGVCFTTDLMVGFPGETEEEFLETMAFTREARFLDLHVFAYSRRKGTPADLYPDQVPEEIKRERSERLIALGKEVQNDVLREIVEKGEPLSTVMETADGDLWHGHSASYVEVAVKSDADLHGKMVNVRPVSRKNGILYGEIIE